MEINDFYRAFEEYKSHTRVIAEVPRFQDASRKINNPKNEDVKIFVSSCTIEEDWINAIEEGLPFIEKAIAEERQFIRNDGEVLPIEKIRKINKQSIQDLAKHSNYITHEPDKKNRKSTVLPDKMLMVRKENDYAVYENRVLYALLKYLESFVSIRLDKIRETTTTYEGSSFVKKDLVVGQRKICVDININEKRKNDPIALKKNKYQDLIKRIDNCLSMIVVLLRTPLMIEIAKVDMISLPITKTNVLRMDKNFKAAVALFDFILNYNKDGYTITREEKSFFPLTEAMQNDYTEIILLLSYLNYAYGNELHNELREQFLIEEEARKMYEQEKILAKVKAFKEKIAASGKTDFEYMQMLEEAIDVLEGRIEGLNTIIREHDTRLREEVEKVKDEFVKEKNEIELKHIEEISSLNSEHQTYIKHIQEEHDSMVNQLKTNLDEINNTLKEVKESNQISLKEKEDIISELTYQRDLAYGEILGFKERLGESPSVEDFTSVERFDEVEKEYYAFMKFFDRAWTATKKQIRKKYLGKQK